MKIKGNRMNNMQKSFKAKQKFRKGFCLAGGTASLDEFGNNMERTNQMREAASRMEAARLKGDAEFAARMATPPVAAPVAAPSNGLLAQTTALAGLSNAERYRLGGSGTAAEASQLGQRSDILARLGGVTPPTMGPQVAPKKPQIGLHFAQDMGSYADGTASLYPQERVRQPEPEKLSFMGHPEKIGGLVKKAYGEATGQIPVAQPKAPQPTDVVGHIKQRAADNISAREYADGTASIDRAEELLRRMQKEYGVSSKVDAPEPSRQPQPAPQPAPAPQGQAPATEPRRGLREDIEKRDDELRKVMKYKCGTASIGHTGKRNMAGGGLVPVDIARGLKSAIIDPIAEDFRNGAKAIKSVRDAHPMVDLVAGFHPVVAGMQVANDVLANDVGVDTVANVAQTIPVIKRVNGFQKALQKNVVTSPGIGSFVVDAPATFKKNVVIAGGQSSAQPANSYAEGGIVRGKGGPTDDEVAMSIGGTEVNLSPREAVLPVKTVMALGGPAAVEELIEATNGKPPVPSGLRQGGKYAEGSVDKAEELMQRVSRRYGVDVPPAAPVVPQQEAAVQADNTGFVSKVADLPNAVASKARGLTKVAVGSLATPFAGAIDAGLNFAANAAGYDRPNTQAFVGPARDLASEGLRQLVPNGGTQSIPEYLGWKKRPDVAQATGTPVVSTSSPVAQDLAGVSRSSGVADPAADIAERSRVAEGLRSFAQRRMNLPPTQQQDVVNGGSLVQRGNVGLRAIANDQGTMSALNEANSQQGTGVAYSTVTGADGKPQVMISGGPATKAQYLDVNGKPTNDWRQTAQYAEAQGQQARNVQRLKEIDAENARSDMASGLPFYQGRGLRATAAQLKADEIAQRGALTPAQAASLGLQRQALDATVANREEDNKRASIAAKQAESETHRKAVDDLVKSWATEDGKLNDQKYAFLQKYASQFERPPGMSSSEHLAGLMDNFAIDTMGDEAGRHWLSQEGTWSGERTKWQKRAAKDSLRRGAPFQSIEYHDPLTGRTIYQSDVEKLSPKQRELFQSRVYQ